MERCGQDRDDEGRLASEGCRGPSWGSGSPSGSCRCSMVAQSWRCAQDPRQSRKRQTCPCRAREGLGCVVRRRCRRIPGRRGPELSWENWYWAAWGRRVVSHQLAKLVQRRRASSGDGSQEVGVARRRDVKGRDLTGTHGQLGERWRDEELAEGEGGGCLSLKVKEQHDDVKGEGRVLGSNRTRSTTTGHRLSSWELPTTRPNAAGQARYIVVVRP